VRDLHILNQRWTITRMRISPGVARWSAGGSSGTERISENAWKMRPHFPSCALPSFRQLFPRVTAQRRWKRTGNGQCKKFPANFQSRKATIAPTLVAPRAEDVHSLVITLRPLRAKAGRFRACENSRIHARFCRETSRYKRSRDHAILVDESHSRCVSLRLHLSVRFSVLSARARARARCSCGSVDFGCIVL